MGSKNSQQQATVISLMNPQLALDFRSTDSALLKRETTIPFQKFTLSMLLSIIINVPLSWWIYCRDSVRWLLVWQRASKALVAERRARTLQDLAAAMVQMKQILPTLLGVTHLRWDGNLTGIGPWTQLTETDDPENPDQFSKELGPFSIKIVSSLFARWHEPPHLITLVGDIQTFAAFYRLGPIHDKPEFVLSHPDFDIQNVLSQKKGITWL